MHPEKSDHTIIAYGLDSSITAEQLRTRYSDYGKIEHVEIIKDVVTKCPKGYAFIEYSNQKESERAYEYGHNIKIGQSKPIKVDYVRAGAQQNFKPRRLGGGYGGKINSGQVRFK